MKVAILGGGITGLTAGYCLAKKGYRVTLFEKETILGGLASGFRQPHWDWPLERAYHHLFANDYDILNFAKEIGFKGIFFKEPVTASLYENPTVIGQPRFNRGQLSELLSNKNFNIYPLDTPIDFLRFPLLSFPQKLCAGAVLASLKFSPFFSFYEKQTAENFLKKTMGAKVWNILWQELFRKKFGKYAVNILASFIWARIKKRTKKLGYIEGGFQTFIDYLEEKNRESGVVIKKGEAIANIVKSRIKFQIGETEFDAVISTLPTAIMVKTTQNLFPKDYLTRFSRLHYLHAVNLIIESRQPLLDKTYWLNVCAEKLPIMVLVQHTNFVDKKHYGGSHILYAGNYVDRDDKLLKMGNDEILNYFLPYLKQINSSDTLHAARSMVFKAQFAQPIFDADFVKNKPDFATPVKNFYIANLDMTYPYDRGTNYAVKLGKEVSNLI